MLTLAEAAVLLGLSPSTLRVQVKNGKLRARLNGKMWFVSEREVERYRAVSLGRRRPLTDEQVAERYRARTGCDGNVWVLRHAAASTKAKS